jgi:hypothetical protein
VEVGTVGNEGMVGMPVYFGAKSSPTEGIWQVSGEALRMKAKDFGREIEKGGALRLVLLRLSRRAAPVALAAHDARPSGPRRVRLTQQFVAQMLAVRRPSVTVAAGILQKAGLIRYRRGALAVVDRRRLEANSCECYEVVKKEFERLLRA